MKVPLVNLILILALILSVHLPSIAAHGGHDHSPTTEPEPTTSGDLSSNPNLPLAFGLVIVGGVSTAIGGLVPFLGSRGVIPAFVENNLFLAGCMGLASGVLLFSSLYHILPETRESFAEGVPGHEELATVGSFFLGAFILMLVEALVHILSPVHGSHDFRKYLTFRKKETRNSESSSSELHQEEVITMSDEARIVPEGAPESSGQGLAPSDSGSEDEKEAADKAELNRMGLFTAIAIAIHNLPESIATFVSTLNSPEIGVVLGIAIAIHHLPEGICIAMPIYVATKSKLKAFLITAILGGITQPLAAILTYLVFATFWSPVANGVLTGLTAGMLVYVVARNLFPTAIKFDPKGKVVAPCFFAGILIICISLICFSYA